MVAKLIREPREDGFTLVELLVVILIIGILSAIAVPAFLNQRKSAQDAVLQSDLKQLKMVYQQYATKNKNMTVYPDLLVNWKNTESDAGYNGDPAGILPLMNLTPGTRFHVFDGSAYGAGYAPKTKIIIEAGREGSSTTGVLDVPGQRYYERYTP